MNTTTTYALTLCTEDGRRFAVVPESPANPRYVHVCDEVFELSDNPEPDTPALHVDTFARVGGSVWVDDTKSALFVRVTL